MQKRYVEITMGDLHEAIFAMLPTARSDLAEWLSSRRFLLFFRRYNHTEVSRITDEILHQKKVNNKHPQSTQCFISMLLAYDFCQKALVEIEANGDISKELMNTSGHEYFLRFMLTYSLHKYVTMSQIGAARNV